MHTYLLIKYCHIGFAVISLLGFLLRGYWMLTDSAWLHKKPTKVLPHINDTLLLLTAVVLVVMSHQYPFVFGWVTLKIGLLLVYIVLGTFALKRGKTRQIRAGCFGLALLTIASIFIVALTKPVFI